MPFPYNDMAINKKTGQGHIMGKRAITLHYFFNTKGGTV
jgi:hypothetical protein